MKILTQNGKMKKSSQNGIDVYNFGIPAFQSETGLRTCPNAGHCASGCYARSGTYRFSNVAKVYEDRLKLTQDSLFVDILTAEVTAKYLKALSKQHRCLIRIHDSGDFYSKNYAKDWFKIIRNRPEVTFYAYTKMVQLFEEFKSQNEIPPNLTMIYSYGGKQDSHIDTERHRHSKVFQSESELLSQGYIDSTQDDLIAALGPCLKIGLVYHGVKSYTNTTWNKVK